MIAMAGEENRRVFFNDRNLDLSGYRIFLGALPNLDDIKVKTEIHDDTPLFIKRLTHLLQRDRVKECTPILCVLFIAETDSSSSCLSTTHAF